MRGEKEGRAGEGALEVGREGGQQEPGLRDTLVGLERSEQGQSSRR